MASWCNTNFIGQSSNPLCYAKNLYLNNELVTSLIIPESVDSIKNYAFYNSSISSISIPNKVTSIGHNAFEECSSLTSVYISDVAAWCNINFASYYSNPLCYAKNLYVNKELITSLTIPESVNSIKQHAFYNSSLTSISIPNSVTSIGEWAFANCKALTSITIPNSITSIGKDAFYYTLWLNNQPDGCIYISKCLYSYKGEMPKHTHINIKEGTNQICESAFEECYNLTSITIPNTVTSIEKGAFYGCYYLTLINVDKYNQHYTSVDGALYTKDMKRLIYRP